MTMKSISIIIPTYNRAQLLRESLTSIIVQDYDFNEIIIIDDGSTDNTTQVIESFALEYKLKNIIYLKQKNNKGISNARNLGVINARSEYIAFLDSDDIWLPNKTNSQLKVFKSNPDINITIGKVKVFSGELVGGKLILSESVSNIYLQASLIKREIFNKVGLFNEKLKFGEDVEWIIRHNKVSNNAIKFTNDTVCLYRRHDGNITKKVYDELKK